MVRNEEAKNVPNDSWWGNERELGPRHGAHHIHVSSQTLCRSSQSLTSIVEQEQILRLVCKEMATPCRNWVDNNYTAYLIAKIVWGLDEQATKLPQTRTTVSMANKKVVYVLQPIDTCSIFVAVIHGVVHISTRQNLWTNREEMGTGRRLQIDTCANVGETAARWWQQQCPART